MSAARTGDSAGTYKTCDRRPCRYAVGRRTGIGLPDVHNQERWCDAVAYARIGTDIRHGCPARRRDVRLRPVVGDSHRRSDLR